MVFYDNIDIAINGSGILADSASISQVNYLDPAYILEKRGEMSQPVKDSIRSTMDISYFVEVDNEPSMGIVNSIKQFRTDDHEAQPFVIELANISGSFYLEDYSMRVQPNATVRAQASFVSYHPLTGDIGVKRTGENAIAYNKSSSLAHGWTTFITNSGTAREVPIYEFTYQFRAQWNPLYTIGHTYPRQVQLLSAGEMIVLDKDNFRHISFSGEKVEEAFLADYGDDLNIDVVRLQLHCDEDATKKLEIGISGGTIVNSRLQTQIGEMARSKIGINRNY